MRLQFLRFGEGITLGARKVSVLEVHNHHLFTRVVRALLSEQGKEAVEPYQLWDSADRPVGSRKAITVVNTLPEVPYDNKTLLGKLHLKICREVDSNPELASKLQLLGIEIAEAVDEIGLALWGTYRFGNDWDLGAFLKAFGYGPDCGEGETLLDNCIRYFGLCADVDPRMPIVMVNAKLFFSQNEIEELYSQAIFLDVPLLLLETVHDGTAYDQERKVVIDQDFLVWD